MLTSTSYLLAMTVYLLSAVLALVLANLWLLARAPLWLRIFVTVPFAALLLTPAYYEAGADTFAPALIVAAFQWLSQGPEAATHAVRPLLLFTGTGLALGTVGGAIAWLHSRRTERPDPALDLASDQ